MAHTPLLHPLPPPPPPLPLSEIYPFVVVVIGLENILVIVKAVISTNPEQDVKFRIAEGEAP